LKILVDGDACPVRELTETTAKRHELAVMYFINDSHIVRSEYSKIIMVSSGRDVADFEIIKHACAGDIIITNDYGLAAMALAKRTYVLSFSGMLYDESNIDSLLMQRHIGMKERRSGNYTKGPKKRTKQDDSNFEAALNLLIEKCKGGS
jgi:hypothetical protein